jgi:hypothetical protein
MAANLGVSQLTVTRILQGTLRIDGAIVQLSSARETEENGAIIKLAVQL